MSFIKVIAESTDLKFIPSNYAYCKNVDESTASDPQVPIPVIDLSKLTSGTPDQQAQVVQDLDRACKDWGFFMLINHGIPESLMKGIIDVTDEFFNLPEEEKLKYQTKHMLDPIRCGTSFNASNDQIFFWRDYLKVSVHPEFHSPNKPTIFSDLVSEYCEKARLVVRKILHGLSQALALENDYMENSLQMDSSQQYFIANYYPPCPQPQLAMGLPPHSDHGLLTLLIQNGIGGLQIQHNGKWVNVNALPNSILVNTADHLEIFSNGRYKSVMHRAAVNTRRKRISIAIANGPSLDAIVRPDSRLLKMHEASPAYVPMKYREYIELQQSNILDGKSALNRVKIKI